MLTIGALLAAYLVARAAIEFVTIDYTNPSSYRPDWGGPSLLGVLAVHCGPGLAVLGFVGQRWRRVVRPGR